MVHIIYRISAMRFLYAQFWINEWYDPTDSDTYFEPVVKDE